MLIGHRFSWAAFLLGPVWLLFGGRWLLALLLLAWDVGVIAVGSAGYLSPGSSALAVLVMALLLGLEASELRRRALARRGKPVEAVASGANESDALAGLQIGVAEVRP